MKKHNQSAQKASEAGTRIPAPKAFLQFILNFIFSYKYFLPAYIEPQLQQS